MTHENMPTASAMLQGPIEPGAYPIPRDLLTNSQQEALDIVRRGGNNADWALMYLTTEAFMQRPDAVDATVAFVENNLNFHPSPGKPTREHARDRTLLASTMGVTYPLVALEAYTAFVRNGGYMPSVSPGSPSDYVVLNGDAPPIVEAYPLGSREDIHMRSINLLMDAGERIAEQARYPLNPYARYNPVWNLEIAVRLGLKPVDHYRNTQRMPDNPAFHPLDRGQIGEAAAQFMRNAMHHILLTEADLPPSTPVTVIQSEAMDRADAVEAAAAHIRELQRARMGIPGAVYEDFRKRFGITPRMIKTTDGYRYTGLDKPPPNRSMCSGQDFHEVPIDNRFVPEVISPIGALVLFSVAIAPQTLYLDRMNSEDLGPCLDNMIAIVKRRRRSGLNTSQEFVDSKVGVDIAPQGVVTKVSGYIRDAFDAKMRHIEETCSPEVIEMAHRLMRQPALNEGAADNMTLDENIVHELHERMQSSAFSGRLGLELARAIHNHPSLRLSVLLGYDQPIDFGDGELDIAFCGLAEPEYLSLIPDPNYARDTTHYPVSPVDTLRVFGLGYYKDPGDAVVQALCMESAVGRNFAPPRRFGDFFVATSHQVDALYEARGSLEAYVHSHEFTSGEIWDQRYMIQRINREQSLGYSYVSRFCTSKARRVGFEDLPPTLLVLEVPNANSAEVENLLEELHAKMDEFQSPRALHEYVRAQKVGASLLPLSGSWESGSQTYNTWQVPSKRPLSLTPTGAAADPVWLLNAYRSVMRTWEEPSGPGQNGSHNRISYNLRNL